MLCRTWLSPRSSIRDEITMRATGRLIKILQDDPLLASSAAAAYAGVLLKKRTPDLQDWGNRLLAAAREALIDHTKLLVAEMKQQQKPPES